MINFGSKGFCIFVYCLCVTLTDKFFHLCSLAHPAHEYNM